MAKTVGKKHFFVFLLLLTFVVACTPQTNEPIKIGATLTLTGFGASYGDSARKGIELAVEQVNKEGGIGGVPLQVVYEDFKEIDLKAAASAAQKLTEIDGVKVILTQWSEDSEVVWPIAAEKGVVTLSIMAGAKGLTKKSPLLFRVWPSDETFVSATVDYALKQGAKKAAIIAEQTAYFTSLKAVNEELWEQKTGSKAFVQEIAPGTVDVKTVLLKIKEEKPDVVFIQVTTVLEGLVLKQAKEIGLEALMIGNVGTDDLVVINTAGVAAEGVVYPQYVPATPEFVEMFKIKYGAEPNIPADHAYDAIMALAKVMREHGTTTKSIQKGLYAIKDYEGASGKITIDETGDRLGKEVQLKTIKNGKGVLLELNQSL